MKMECIANPWNSPNNINEYLSETVSENIIDLRDKVFEKCGLPSCGLVLIMDEENEAHYQGSFWEGKLGFYFNAKELKTRGEELGWIAPNKLIFKLVESECYEHVIWLSQKAYMRDKVEFVWTLIHEIRHMQQSIINHSLLLAGCFLYYTMSKIESVDIKLPITIPTELDAEREAWCISRQVFENETIVEQFVENNCKFGTKVDEFNILYSKFINSTDFYYDVCGQMITFLKKHKSSIEKLQNNPKIFDYLKKDKFDVDTILKSLSRESSSKTTEKPPNKAVHLTPREKIGDVLHIISLLL
jgi:hypothetical protein